MHGTTRVVARPRAARASVAAIATFATSLGVTSLGLGPATANAQVISWTTIVNNGDTVPGTSGKLFNSYNQPSINSKGLVVFRARSTGGDGGGGGGGGGGSRVSGIFERDMSKKNAQPATILDNTTAVPAPNNTGSIFTEFPSIPRIDIQTSAIATRGQAEPVWEYTAADGTDTRAGTSGIYMNLGKATSITAMAQLGAVPNFSYWQVPGASPGTKFDQLPGAPSPAGQTIVFKGNWTDAGGAGQTGVYYRNLTATGGTLPVYRIADTSTIIPDQGVGGTTTFGSTAPPSAVNRQAVFVGLDNEDAPTMGGIYMANLAPNPKLTTLVKIGDPVPGVAGATLDRIGEALSFNGRYVSFWGAWNTDTQYREITLICPTDGNQDLIAYCNETYPDGFTTTEPINQGVFVTDTVTGQTFMVAQTGRDHYEDFLYWVFSGRPPGTGDGGEDFEPARWRSSAFSAISTAPPSYSIAFKATKDDHVTQGIYAALGTDLSLDAHMTVVDTNSFAGMIDPNVNALGSASPLVVTAVGIERDGFRKQQLAISLSMANEDASVSWAGLYLALWGNSKGKPQ